MIFILVDKLVFTKKILLYAGNSLKQNNPFVLVTTGTIYLLLFRGQSAGNLGFSTKVTTATKNTYNKYTDLPKLSEHVPRPKKDLTEDEYGYFLAGLIEGDG